MFGMLIISLIWLNYFGCLSMCLVKDDAFICVQLSICLLFPFVSCLINIRLCFLRYCLFLVNHLVGVISSIVVSCFCLIILINFLFLHSFRLISLFFIKL